MIDTIHIHEDDWGMRNLHPLSALTEAMRDITRAAEAGEKNRAPDGVGWMDVHVIGEPSADYSSVPLPLAAIASALEPLMPRVRRFTATAAAGKRLQARECAAASSDTDETARGREGASLVPRAVTTAAEAIPIRVSVGRYWVHRRCSADAAVGPS